MKEAKNALTKIKNYKAPDENQIVIEAINWEGERELDRILLLFFLQSLLQ